jgi:hypothetical protein
MDLMPQHQPATTAAYLFAGISQLSSTKKKRGFGMDGDVETATQTIVARGSDGEPLTVRTYDLDKPENSDICFNLPDAGAVLVLKNNGEIYVHGRRAATDIEVVDAMREFLSGAKKVEAACREIEKEYEGKENQAIEKTTEDS